MMLVGGANTPRYSEKDFEAKWNAALVSKTTGLTGDELAGFIKYCNVVRMSFGRALPFHDFICGMTAENIRLYTMNRFCQFKLKVLSTDKLQEWL